ncbi:MAG TPA: hypothetical protein VJ894_05085, partial [Cryomorphaceae bacterium]|nr:hypothetical protein [Cryomorphaceae bacterium]
VKKEIGDKKEDDHADRYTGNQSVGSADVDPSELVIFFGKSLRQLVSQAVSDAQIKEVKPLKNGAYGKPNPKAQLGEQAEVERHDYEAD